MRLRTNTDGKVNQSLDGKKRLRKSLEAVVLEITIDDQ